MKLTLVIVLDFHVRLLKSGLRGMEEKRRQSAAESLTGINFAFQHACACNQQPKMVCYDHQEMMPINQSLNTARQILLLRM